MNNPVLRPKVAYYYQCVLANAMLCKSAWNTNAAALSIFFGQSAGCSGIRNNYEIQSTGHKRAYNGANHKPDAERGDLGYDSYELTSAYTFAEVDTMMRKCPDYRPPAA